MGRNLLLGLAIYLAIFAGTAISGRFPVEIYKLRLDDDQYDASEVRNLWGGGGDDGSQDSFEQSREASLENLEEDTQYVTDVQINELQNAQDKVRQDQATYQVDPRCPIFNGFCNSPVCTSDSQCGKKICCYNGCVHTCLDEQPTSIEVDWIPLDSQDNESLLTKPSQSSGAETITIPGGCRVSRMQKSSLDLFFKYGHVTKCVCLKDDVVCHVRKRDTFPNASDNEVRFH